METRFLFWSIIFVGLSIPDRVFALLTPGDIAIVEYNATDPDGFSFLLLTDIPEGEVIYFTDCGWSVSGAFRESEGLIQYTVPVGGLSKGYIVSFSFDKRNENGFTTTGVNGFFGLSKEGDQILAFQGSYTTPVFLFGLNNLEDKWQDDAITTNSSALPPGLEIGKTAISLKGNTNASFNCSYIVKDKEKLLGNIANPSCWDYSSSRITQASECSYSVLPINIISFEVEQSGKDAIITIQTTGIDSYPASLEIERSSDGYYFERIELGINDFSVERNEIRILDHNIQNSVYYRVYFDSALKGVKFLEKEGRLDSGLGKFELYSIDGQLITREYIYPEELEVNLICLTEKLNEGIYLGFFSNNNEKKVVRKIYK
ncbi:hypothetical protein [Sporocytophaga myxococcoides]|uniref:hypothetical protein n=1 Tax=Sporocytophaga myxococcoides TaxID=153721 RepID=UPI0003F7365D|nr:hypothetical protein [Sporocytophaga myxococcoides]